MAGRRMAFSAILLNSIAPIPDGMWRHPRAANGYDFATPEYWEDIARTLERGGFDAVFLADLLHPHEVYAGTHEPPSAWARNARSTTL